MKFRPTVNKRKKNHRQILKMTDGHLNVNVYANTNGSLVLTTGDPAFKVTLLESHISYPHNILVLYFYIRFKKNFLKK